MNIKDLKIKDVYVFKIVRNTVLYYYDRYQYNLTIWDIPEINNIVKMLELYNGEYKDIYLRLAQIRGGWYDLVVFMCQCFIVIVDDGFDVSLEERLINLKFIIYSLRMLNSLDVQYHKTFLDPVNKEFLDNMEENYNVEYTKLRKFCVTTTESLPNIDKLIVIDNNVDSTDYFPSLDFDSFLKHFSNFRNHEFPNLIKQMTSRQFYTTFLETFVEDLD